jgi:oligo-alginate lyase
MSDFEFGKAVLAAICIASSAGAQSHPSVFLTARDGPAIRAAAAKYPVLAKSLAEAKQEMVEAISHPLEVPPPGEAGGYEHERHKQNYREMQTAGELYQITGDRKYASFVRDMLEKYAVLYPTLGAHPLSKDQAPGKLFHQSLNEANWLVATAIAYDCVYDALTPAERARFEKNIFRPMADWLSVNQAREFDRIHNHGTWATAAVGMIGYVMHDTSYVNRALYGTKRNKSGGFIRQLDELFSPDGYYMEGPYYVRYALLPFYQFAEAIENNQPQLKIYDYRGGILKKGLYAALQTTFPNGVFAPINDASRTMDVTTPEVVLALDLAYGHYGADANLLGEAALQHDVILAGGGLKVARDLALHPDAKAVWPSVEFTDGPDGKEGGLGILRAGAGRDATMLLMKYGVHGQGHGHFDKLHFIFFDGGNEVVPDYGFARWINIEPKDGGRYLPENDSYAKQTIAHNTVVVDETTQSKGNYQADEKKSAQRNFFDASSPAVQVMSAKADGFYDGVGMQRTMLLVRDQRLPYPVVVDVYRLTSAAQHTYDYPLHFRGQLITTNVPYKPHTADQKALGSAFGYQHIWNEASGPAGDSAAKLTWLDGHRYYTAITTAGAGAEVIFGRTGAADSSFNLISEPMMIVRQRASDQTFASVIEPHGFFSEMEERSLNARGVIAGVRVLASTSDGSVVEVTGANGLRWVVMINNGPASATAHHSVSAGGQAYQWTGNYSVTGVNAKS